MQEAAMMAMSSSWIVPAFAIASRWRGGWRWPGEIDVGPGGCSPPIHRSNPNRPRRSLSPACGVVCMQRQGWYSVAASFWIELSLQEIV
jgi:hypothetical protein